MTQALVRLANVIHYIYVKLFSIILWRIMMPVMQVSPRQTDRHREKDERDIKVLRNLLNEFPKATILGNVTFPSICNLML